MMDHDAGRSIASASKACSDSITSCKISFQGYQDLGQLYAAIVKHATRTTGILIQFSSLSGFVRRSDMLSPHPPALAPASCSATSTGILAECVRSSSDIEKFAFLFCESDAELAREWLEDGAPSRGARQSPSALDPSLFQPATP